MRSSTRTVKTRRLVLVAPLPQPSTNARRLTVISTGEVITCEPADLGGIIAGLVNRLDGVTFRVDKVQVPA